jgi:hypothetical protein
MRRSRYQLSHSRNIISFSVPVRATLLLFLSKQKKPNYFQNGELVLTLERLHPATAQLMEVRMNQYMKLLCLVAGVSFLGGTGYNMIDHKLPETPAGIGEAAAAGVADAAGGVGGFCVFGPIGAFMGAGLVQAGMEPALTPSTPPNTAKTTSAKAAGPA